RPTSATAACIAACFWSSAMVASAWISCSLTVALAKLSISASLTSTAATGSAGGAGSEAASGAGAGSAVVSGAPASGAAASSAGTAPSAGGAAGSSAGTSVGCAYAAPAARTRPERARAYFFMAILLRSQERASTEENFCAISFRTRESGDKRQTRSLSALALYVGPGDTTCKRAATTCPAERVNCCLLDRSEER